MFNEFINKRRKELNLSVDDLVRISGIPKSTLSKITAGINTNPTLSTVETLCKALNCSLNEAVGYENDSFSVKEQLVIQKYRVLDEHGKKMVDFALNEEYSRCTADEDEEEPEKLLQIKHCEYKVSAGHGFEFFADEEWDEIA
ncbi:MAG: helix-turn-helix transcriptional regulator, partial [Oscillospiraceae bacterium]|nr:helix-turn-helix transcriptional regulator [Oscillospiraceae bacterium]